MNRRRFAFVALAGLALAPFAARAAAPDSDPPPAAAGGRDDLFGGSTKVGTDPERLYHFGRGEESCEVEITCDPASRRALLVGYEFEQTLVYPGQKAVFTSRPGREVFVQALEGTALFSYSGVVRRGRAHDVQA